MSIKNKKPFIDLSAKELTSALSYRKINNEYLKKNHEYVKNMIITGNEKLLAKKLKARVLNETKFKTKEPLDDKIKNIKEMFKSKVFRQRVDAAMSKAFYLQSRQKYNAHTIKMQYEPGRDSILYYCRIQEP